MSTLRIYFSGNWRDSSSPCPWALCDEGGAILQSGTDPLASLPKGHECVGVVASDRVLCLNAKAPIAARRKWLSSLPFVAEEHTLPDPQENHVIPSPIMPDGSMTLAVVDKSWISRIVDACRTVNLSLRRMVPETFLLPLTQGAWTLAWSGNNGFVRTGKASGLPTDEGSSDNPPLALRLSLDAAPSKPEKIELCFMHNVPEEARALPDWKELHVPVTQGATWDWRRATIPADSLNLLWGDFAPRLKIGEWWPILRPAVPILLALLGIEILGANIEWAMLANEKRSLMQDMEHTYRRTFGEAGTLVNAPLQMQRNLADLRHGAGLPDDGDFLPLLDTASKTLASLAPGSLQGLHYESGRLDLDIKLAKSADFPNLKRQLETRGLKVQMTDAHDAGNGAQARLTLMAGDGS